jgi:Xaa-Pro aminopeptidase
MTIAVDTLAASARTRVLDGMAARGIDVLLLGRESNARFVSGAARLFMAAERAFAPGCVVVRATGAVHLLSTGDAGIPESIPREHLYLMSWNPATLMGRIAALPGVADADVIGVDGLTPLFEGLIGGALPDPRLVDGEALLRDVRRVKTPDEIGAIRAAAAVAEIVLHEARTAASNGAAPDLVRAVAMETMAREGVTTASFEPLVVPIDGGVEGSLAIDVGVLRGGWEAGLARTVPGAAASDDHQRALDQCRPGALPRELMAAGHQLYGVGVGYEVLEPDRALEANMTVSVSTGPLRDIVLVTDGTPVLLTTAPY